MKNHGKKILGSIAALAIGFAGPLSMAVPSHAAPTPSASASASAPADKTDKPAVEAAYSFTFNGKQLKDGDTITVDKDHNTVKVDFTNTGTKTITTVFGDFDTEGKDLPAQPSADGDASESGLISGAKIDSLSVAPGEDASVELTFTHLPKGYDKTGTFFVDFAAGSNASGDKTPSAPAADSSDEDVVPSDDASTPADDSSADPSSDDSADPAAPSDDASASDDATPSDDASASADPSAPKSKIDEIKDKLDKLKGDKGDKSDKIKDIKAHLDKASELPRKVIKDAKADLDKIVKEGKLPTVKDVVDKIKSTLDDAIKNITGGGNAKPAVFAADANADEANLDSPADADSDTALPAGDTTDDEAGDLDAEAPSDDATPADEASDDATPSDDASASDDATDENTGDSSADAVKDDENNNYVASIKLHVVSPEGIDDTDAASPSATPSAEDAAASDTAKAVPAADGEAGHGLPSTGR